MGLVWSCVVSCCVGVGAPHRVCGEAVARSRGRAAAVTLAVARACC